MITPTKEGFRFVQTEEFRRICKAVAASVIRAGQPYEEIEGRCRVLTIEALLPKGKSYTGDEAATFFIENSVIIDSAWRGAISSMMATIDDDLAGTLAREFSIKLPSPPKGVATAEQLDHVATWEK